MHTCNTRTKYPAYYLKNVSKTLNFTLLLEKVFNTTSLCNVRTNEMLLGRHYNYC